VPRRSGQFALLGVIVLATTLVLLAAQRPPEPAFALERGQMQSAQLIHLARYCLAVGCSNETLGSLVAGLLALNSTEPLYMYPVADAKYYYSAPGSSENRTVVFTITTLRGSEAVSLRVYTAPAVRLGALTKQVHEHTLIFYNCTLTYQHVYTSPFFPGGSLTYCPRLYDPRGLADVRRGAAPCWWVVLVPATPDNTYTLYDEFGIPVRVVVP
jgi:hypothetical protein